MSGEMQYRFCRGNMWTEWFDLRSSYLFTNNATEIQFRERPVFEFIPGWYQCTRQREVHWFDNMPSMTEEEFRDRWRRVEVAIVD